MHDSFAVSIIIPLYGRRDLTERCLSSIVAHTPDDLYEVVLVDNASPDDTSVLLDALEGDVTIIRNETNLGYAKACNQGAAAARGELLLFLNNDTEATPEWLTSMLRPLRRESGLAAVGARLVYPDRTIQHAGCLLAENRDTGLIDVHHRHRGEPEHHAPALQALDLSAVTAAALLVRRRVFEAAGGFDEGYWNGYEDVDLCLRIRDEGWGIRYEPSALLVHHEGASGSERVSRHGENAVRFAQRWAGRFQPDVVIESGQAAEPPLAIGPDHPEPEMAAVLWRTTMRVANQRRSAARLDGADAEALLDRLQREEERRLLEVVRAGRDVCWLDEGVDEPLVTIAIPTYNRGQMVADRAIASALAQTYTNIEVLVVGDACDEATERAVRSVDDPRLRFVNLPARGMYPEDPMHKWMVAGTAPANMAIDLARGAWITRCDDDDEFTPDHVEVLLRAAREQRVELIYSQARMEVAPGQWTVIGSEPLQHGQVTHGSVLYSLGLRFFRYSNACWKLDEPGDWNMWRRMLGAGVRTGFLPEVTYVHHVEAHQREDGVEDAPIVTPERVEAIAAVPAHGRARIPAFAGGGGSAPVSSSPVADEQVLVQLGCGPNKLPGWVNVDIDPAYEPEVTCDLSRGLPLPDDSVDVVYSEHFFEHLDLADGMRLLGSIHRCLRPGGVIRIAMPDLADVVRSYLGDWRDQRWIQDPAYAYIDTAAHVINVCFREWGHRYLYDRDDLALRLEQCGYVDVRQMVWGESDVAALAGRETRPESTLVFEARKP